jgi:hypothetical protein
MNPTFCLMINLVIYLKETLSRDPNQVHMFTNATADNAPKNLIPTYCKRLEKVIGKHQEFKALETEDDEEGVGTHSYCIASAPLITQGTVVVHRTR